MKADRGIVLAAVRQDIRARNRDSVAHLAKSQIFKPALACATLSVSCPGLYLCELKWEGT